jgi:hypothetical protein
MNFLRYLLALVLLGSAGAATAAPDAAGLFDTLVALAPDVSVEALEHALEARDCAIASGAALAATRLAVIDYSRPSTEKRLWVFELGETPKLLFAEHVAHGRGSGENLARAFSNREGSHQTSLGLFRTAETYQGGNGYSMRLDGLEPGVNDAARARAIVMHGAPYVEPALAQKLGRLGRSYGCPAVRHEVARPMIDSLRNGQLLFAYYPDSSWKSGSPFLGCQARSGLVAKAGVSTPSATLASSGGAACSGPACSGRALQ